MDDLFLSPRVLDERAFGAFADELRGLIREALDAERALRRASSGIGELRRMLKTGTDELREGADRARGALPALDQRLAQARGLLERVTGRLAQIGEAERRLDEMVEARVASAERRLADAAAAGEAKLDALERAAERVAQTIGRALAARAAAIEGDLTRKLDELERRAGDLPVPAAEVRVPIAEHRAGASGAPTAQ